MSSSWSWVYLIVVIVGTPSAHITTNGFVLQQQQQCLPSSNPKADMLGQQQQQQQQFWFSSSSTQHQEEEQQQQQKQLDNTKRNDFVVPRVGFNKPPYSHRKEEKAHVVVYKHLFRLYEDISFDSWIRCEEPISFLRSVGLTDMEIQQLERQYPKLPEMDVHGQVAPKIRFLVETLGGGSGRLTWNNNNNNNNNEFDSGKIDKDLEECPPHFEQNNNNVHSLRLSHPVAKQILMTFLSPKYQLDRIVGPRHAFLMKQQLPHGPTLLEKDGLLLFQFLQTCETSSSKLHDFVQLCNQWNNDNSKNSNDHYTESMVRDFCMEFGLGLTAAAKKKQHQQHQHKPGGPPVMSSIQLLIHHGANYKETDSHGVTPLHLAAGMGNCQGVGAILAAMEEEGSSTVDKILNDISAKDGATAFHWACCGIDDHEIGTGGSLEVCEWMWNQATNEEERKSLVNARTFSNATPLMWAAWSGSQAMTLWLLEKGADPGARDRNGGTAAHWAAAAGDLPTCQSLAQVLGSKIFWSETDKTGTTPLDYANQMQNFDVVQWIMRF